MTMGTTYQVRLVRSSAPVVSEDRVRAEIDNILDRIDRSMSNWRRDSEISRFNASASTEWLPASSGLVAVMRRAEQVSELSGGAFDVTVAPLIDLWGFGPNPRERALPADAAIVEARAAVGYRHVAVRDDPPGLRKDDPRVTVNLAGIAPGYAVDCIADRMAELGFKDALVELGGEVRARGRRPDGTPWRVAIEKPVSAGREVQWLVALSEGGLSTSGDYRAYFEHDGQRYSHTIDPHTGRPVTHALASVSVIHADTISADALATALLVLGPDAGRRLAEEQGLAVLFVVREGAGFREYRTPGFERYLAAP